jgi:hypothetical protein
METPEQAYSLRQVEFEQTFSRYQKISKTLAWLRLFTFLSLLVFLYIGLSSKKPVIGLVIAGTCLILLIILIILNASYNRKRDYFSHLVELCKKEIKAIRHDFLEFPDGSEFIDNSHAYASDIDLFGPGSAYQYINRTVTHLGKLRLVAWLKSPCLDADEIDSRQEACREASAHIDWRLQFAACGHETEVKDSPDSLLDWIKLPDIFSNHKRLTQIISVWQAVMVLILIIVVAGWINYNYLVLVGLINLGIVGAYLKKINEVSHFFGKSYSMMTKYSGLFSKISESGFKTSWMRQRIDLLVSGNGSAAIEIGILRKLLQQFDSRNNLLVGFSRNALFLTDLLLVIKMETWRRNNKGNIQKWLEVLGQVDAMNSLATFAFNNPGYSFPVPVEGEFSLEAKGLGHPLIPQEERVCNAFSLENWHTLVVLTGANMAGKSTFLRTIGINHILAHTGSPVCATDYRFKPSLLITSIRTNDSLIKHESYFYAELKKLKSIIDALEQGQEVFILLDEVLKGTNSNDKLNGSIILIKKLLQLQTSGIIATHDISLGELEKEFPDHIINRCFEAEISNGQLIFDYKLKQGTAKNMTALFLMKQMNIV